MSVHFVLIDIFPPGERQGRTKVSEDASRSNVCSLRSRRHLTAGRKASSIEMPFGHSRPTLTGKACPPVHPKPLFNPLRAYFVRPVPAPFAGGSPLPPQPGAGRLRLTDHAVASHNKVCPLFGHISAYVSNQGRSYLASPGRFYFSWGFWGAFFLARNNTACHASCYKAQDSRQA